MARAMSASLASARMKSRQPCGSAWMRASLTSRDFCTTETPRSATVIRMASRPLPGGPRDGAAVRRGGGVALGGRLHPDRAAHLADAGLDLVDDVAQHPCRLLQA